jgi:hypothetical protein
MGSPVLSSRNKSGPRVTTQLLALMESASETPTLEFHFVSDTRGLGFHRGGSRQRANMLGQSTRNNVTEIKMKENPGELMQSSAKHSKPFQSLVLFLIRPAFLWAQTAYASQDPAGLLRKQPERQHWC